MKKALALVLALVLALSMAVSALALGFVVLDPETEDTAGKTVITVVDAKAENYMVYVDKAGTYYIALNTEINYEDVVVTANGCVDAKLVEFDPETMVIKDEDKNDLVYYAVTYKGKAVADIAPMHYDEAKAEAKKLNDQYRVNHYGIVCVTNVDVIEVKVADNFGVHYEEGTIEITATVKDAAGKKVPYAGTISFLNDVIIFEYEEVKYAAANKGAALQLGAFGYSDAFTAENGYGKEYKEEDLRNRLGALVVSTTAFRAIEGKDLQLNVLKFKTNDFAMDVHVTLKEIVAGQKGVNFFCYADLDYTDKDADKKFDKGELNAVTFGFKGNQVVKGAFEVVVELPIDYYELRELFGLKVEEEDIITYYVVDENGVVVAENTVDYMKDDISKTVKVSVPGENDVLGSYTLCLEVPAVEEEAVEENPNTGAESVVGVVAALAVVSVATAAAVSLKK